MLKPGGVFLTSTLCLFLNPLTSCHLRHHALLSTLSDARMVAVQWWMQKFKITDLEAWTISGHLHHTCSQVSGGREHWMILRAETRDKWIKTLSLGCDRISHSGPHWDYSYLNKHAQYQTTQHYSLKSIGDWDSNHCLMSYCQLVV